MESCFAILSKSKHWKSIKALLLALTSSVARISASFSSKSLMTPMLPLSAAMWMGVLPSAIARLASAPDFNNILKILIKKNEFVTQRMVRWLLRALLPLGLIYPAGNVKRRLTNLASPHMDLSSVTQKSLHNRGLS